MCRDAVEERNALFQLHLKYQERPKAENASGRSFQNKRLPGTPFAVVRGSL